MNRWIARRHVEAGQARVRLFEMEVRRLEVGHIANLVNLGL